MKLKKIFILLGILVIIPSFMAGVELSIGPCVGFSLNHYWGSDAKRMRDEDALNRAGVWDPKPHWNVGLSGGAFFRIQFLDWFILEPEFLFDVRKAGYKLKNVNNEDETIFVNTRVFLIDLPVLVRFKFNRFSIFTGPNFMFKVGKTHNIERNSDTGSKVKTNVDKRYQKIFALGMIMGLGYDFPVGSKGGYFVLDLRYNLSFMSFDKYGGIYHDDRKLNALTIGLGYGFKLK